MQITNRRLVEEGPDFYPTPKWGTLALLKYEKFEGSILEPCCGEGDMSEIIKENGYNVISSDLYDRGYGINQNLFDINERFDNLITNPPFGIAEEVLSHAFKITNNKICLLLRTAFLESKRRYYTFYSKFPPSRVLIFSERLSMYPKGYEVKGGGTTSYAWFIWDNADWSKQTIIKWIEPGLKNSCAH